MLKLIKVKDVRELNSKIGFKSIPQSLSSFRQKSKL